MQKLTLEYPLSTRSTRLVWDMISNAAGLQKWLAEKEKMNYIRLLWDYHEDTPEAYWEIRISESDLTGMLSLLITDFAADDDEEADLRGIWDDNFERLHRVSGF